MGSVAQATEVGVREDVEENRMLCSRYFAPYPTETVIQSQSERRKRQGAHLSSFDTTQVQIPKQEISVPQQSKFLLYSEDFTFVDTANLASLLVAATHIDGSDLKLPTGGN